MHINKLSKIDQINLQIVELEVNLMFDATSNSRELELISWLSAHEAQLSECQNYEERIIELEQYLLNLKYLAKDYKKRS